MDELVKAVAAKAGITEAQAKSAVETVLGFLKAKLPAPLAGQLDGLLAPAAGAVAGLDVAKVAGALGGLFGGGNKG